MGHGPRGLFRQSATRGAPSRTNTPAAGPIAGARTACSGITDRECRLCFALALWNEQDPILKERLFGLTGPQGNHGEDVKELYYYLDATPTHSYLQGALQVSAGRVSLRAAGHETRRPGDKLSPGIRAARHGHLRTAAATSTSSPSTPRPAPTTC